MTRSVPPELARVVDALTEESAGVFARESIIECVGSSFQDLVPARMHNYLPLLAHRFARERLRATALAQGLVPHATPVVLFVCTHNAGRSQLAAALLTDRAQTLLAELLPAPAA